MDGMVDLQRLAVAAAIGFLIGFEREWRHKEDAKRRNFAGARTFTLTAFAGALAAMLGDGLLLLAVGLGSIALLSTAAYWAEARQAPGAGGTTEIALLAAFLLGALAARGEVEIAAAAGVGAAIILASKPRISGIAEAMNRRELGAAFRFLAISVIVLPILPDAGYGPYDALNPRSIWWLVVLISGLSFLGYWLTKLKGAGGVVLTGIVGGLASSTAATLSLSRIARDGAAPPAAAAAGIVAANVVMIARIAVLLFVVSAQTLLAVWPALLAAFAAGLVGALVLWRGRPSTGVEVELGNPMELKPTLFFAALLALIAVASRAALEMYGEQGLYGVAVLTGLADVDALTLTAANQAKAGAIAQGVAGAAALIAAASNIVVKGAMAFGVAGAATGLRVVAAFAAVLAAGAAALLLF